jgi:nicotinate-nucleotide adenylyltransferase
VAERIGVLGGTFDPVHRGHLEAARQVRRQLGLDRVLLVPAANPPHRRGTVASAADRLAMVEAAVAGLSGLEASGVEVARGGVSYTVDTLRELAGLHPGAELFLLLGWDAARDLPTWREPDEVAALSHLVVFNRRGAAGQAPTGGDDSGAAGAGEPPSAEALIAAGLPAAAVVLHVDSPEVSATALRAELAAGGDGGDALPASVLRLIRERHLYSGTAQAPVS